MSPFSVAIPQPRENLHSKMISLLDIKIKIFHRSFPRPMILYKRFLIHLAPLRRSWTGAITAIFRWLDYDDPQMAL